jgi:hypothetical protein
MLAKSLLVAILLQSSVCWPSHEDSTGRAKRLLQTVTIGSYTAEYDAGYTQYCTSQGINIDELEIPLAELQGKIGSAITDYYKEGRAQFEEFIQTERQKFDVAAYLRSNGWPLVFPVLVVLAASILFSILFCVWICLRNSWKPQCLKKFETGKNYTRCWYTALWGTLILGFICIVLAIVFGAFVVTSISKSNKLQCYVFQFSDEVINGVDKNGHFFLGLDGIGDLMRKLSAGIDGSSQAVKDTSPALMNSGLSLLSGELAASHRAFLNGLNDEGMKVISATGIAQAKFTTDLMAEKAKVFRETLDQEVSDIVRLAGYVELAGKGLTKIYPNHKEYSLHAKFLWDKVDTSSDTIILGKDAITKDLSIERLKTTARTVFSIGIICIIVLYIVYVVILYFNVEKEKWLTIRWINYAILIIKILFNILILVYSGLAIFLANLFNFGCFAALKLIADQPYNQYLNPRAKEIRRMVDACIGPNPTGSLIAISTEEGPEYLDYMNAISGVSSLHDTLKTKIGASTWYGKGLLATITNRRDLKESDSSSSGENGINEAIKYFNSKVSCANDEFAYFGNCTKASVSTSSDAFSKDAGTGYCMQATTTSTSKYASRYASPASCVTDSKVKSGLAASIIDSIEDYKIKAQSLLNEYTNTYNKQDAVMTRLNSLNTQLTTVSSSLAEVNSILNEVGGDVSTALSCTYMRRQMIIGINVVCVELGNYYMIHTMLIVNLSVIFFFYTLCLFCGIRIGDIERERLAAPTAQNLPFHVVDVEDVAVKYMDPENKFKEKKELGHRKDTPQGRQGEKIVMNVTD